MPGTHTCQRTNGRERAPTRNTSGYMKSDFGIRVEGCQKTRREGCSGRWVVRAKSRRSERAWGR